MRIIEPDTRESKVVFKKDCLDITEYVDDDILTNVQIRLEGQDVWLFVSEYDKKLHHVKMSYQHFKEEMLKMAKTCSLNLLTD